MFSTRQIQPLQWVIRRRLTKATVNSSRASIRIDGPRIFINNAVIQSQILSEYISSQDDKESAIGVAAEIGAYALARANAKSSYMELEESLRLHLESNISLMVKNLLDQTNRQTQDQIRDLKKLIEKDIDPTKTDSTLGRIFKKLGDLLDERRSDSVPTLFQDSLKKFTALDGIMQKVVRETVQEVAKPLTIEIERLSRSVDKNQTVNEQSIKSTSKGATFEEEIVEQLQQWKIANKAIIEYTGPDNKTGDIVVHMGEQPFSKSKSQKSFEIPRRSFKIVIEAKNRGGASTRLGRKQISDILSRAVVKREADAAIILGSSADVFSKEIGEFDEGFVENRLWCACVPENLLSTLRYVYLTLRLQEKAEKLNDPTTVACAALRSQVGEIRGAMTSVAQIKRRATEISKLSDSISIEAADMHRKVMQKLNDMERELNPLLENENVSKE